MRKLLVCAALLLAAVSHTSGQEAEAARPDAPSSVRPGDAGAEAERLLSSTGRRERAWGAYLSGLHGMKGHAPALVAILEDESLSAGGREDLLVRQAALDALIRLDAEVSSDALMPLYDSSPDEVLILLARSPRKHAQALLSLFDEKTPPVQWLAAGNLLAETRAAGFAARLLGQLKIDATVYVYDREGPHDLREGGGNGSGGCGRGGLSRDREFPPVFYYELGEYASRGAVVVARGPRVVYYTRSLYPSTCPQLAGWFDRDSVRVEYLAHLLNTTVQGLDFTAYSWHEVVCKGEAQCRKTLAGVRDRVVNSYSALLRRLSDDDLIDDSEAAELKPDITFYVHDARARKSFPLPPRLRGVKVTIEDARADSPCCGEEPPAPEQTPPAR